MPKPTVQPADDLAAQLHDAYTATRTLWQASRQGGQFAIATQAAQAYAAALHAVDEAAKHGLVRVERDRDGNVVAIRMPGEETEP